MDKLYSSHVRDIERQIKEANKHSVAEISATITTPSELVVAVGSGGSLTCAHFFAALYQSHTKKPCFVMTPLEMLVSGLDLASATVWVFSAEGKNPDVLKVCQFLLNNSKSVTVILNRSNTPVSKLFNSPLSGFKAIELETPYKDGFLATVSITHTCTVLLRAFLTLSSDEISVRPVEPNFIPENIHEFRGAYCGQRRIILLYSPSLKCAAEDFSTRCHESGVATAQLTDFRNFAHGRHFGADVFKEDTFIIFFTDFETKMLVESIKQIIGGALSHFEFRFCDERSVGIYKSVIAAQLIFGEICQYFDYEPNIVDVKDFGRSLYSLDAYSKIERVSNRVTHEKGLEFKGRLENVEFGGIVFDYDGTLCFTKNRFDSIDSDLSKYINRLLRGNISIGVATGRGKSAGDELRKVIPPELQSNVLIGYYNGAIINPLDQELNIDEVENDRSLQALYDSLLETYKGESGVRMEFRPVQLSISIENNCSVKSELLYENVCSTIAVKQLPLKALKSTHSVDIINMSTSKLNVLRRLENESFSPVLAIGDNGQLGGNDFELLAHKFGLSANNESMNVNSCFRISPNNLRELDSTLWYLKHISLSENNKFKIKL